MQIWIIILQLQYGCDMERIQEIQQFCCAGHSYTIGAFSDIGGRNYQEDRLLVTEREEHLLLTVCDGMGGANGGALASQTVVDQLYALFMKDDITVPSVFYRNCVDILDACVFFLTDENQQRMQAGTTIVSVIVSEYGMDWLSIGDSRLYIMRQGELVQISTDHNYREELLELLSVNHITEEQFQAEKDKHLALTSYLGIGGIQRMDISNESLQLCPGDLVLLATDGLYNSVSIPSLLTYGDQSVEELMRDITKKINECHNSEQDNTSFILIKYEN